MADESFERFLEQTIGESHLRVDEDLGGGFVRLRVSEAERRQAQQDIRCVEDIVLELLRNARDAGSRLICIATAKEGSTRNIVTIDDGEGIPQEMWTRVFEPRVTSRLDSFHVDQWGVHGRGMALYSIACNTEEHRVVSSEVGMGTVISVKADTSKLHERTDQSTVPRMHRESDGRVLMRGPRNINRIVAEYAIGQHGNCLLYIGSPNEILATLVAYGKHILSSYERTFAEDANAYPLYLRPSLAASPEDLVQTASSLGLSTSTRSARRILDGEVSPLEPFTSTIASEEIERDDSRRAKQATPRKRAVHLSSSDIDAFGNSAMAAYRTIANSYFLNAEVEPSIRVTRDGLHLFIPFAEEEGEAR